MPNKTFLNLPNRRQKKIINTAYEEFALYDYENASLSRIIKRLKLAKGSFYRYFNSKRELYNYLIEKATTLQMEYLQEMMDKPVDDFFDLLETVFERKITFDQDFPLQSGFLYNISQERNNEELGDTHFNSKNQIIGLLKVKLVEAQENGSIRNDIDIEILSFLLAQIQLGIYDFLSMQDNVDFRENIKKNKPLYVMSEEKVRLLASSFANILKNGMMVSAPNISSQKDLKKSTEKKDDKPASETAGSVKEAKSEEDTKSEEPTPKKVKSKKIADKSIESKDDKKSEPETKSEKKGKSKKKKKDDDSEQGQLALF